MYKRILKFLASLKLAVAVLLGLGIISAVGTFYESLYNADYAKLVVYQSVWMVLLQVALAISLTAVMVDRWPWKPKHSAFLCAHVGILLILAGSVQTYYTGIDGVMVFPLKGSNRFVFVNEKELSIYSSLDGNKFEVVFSEPVNFFKSKPQKQELVFDKGSYSELKVKDYYIFAEAKNQVLTSQNKSDGPAVRFFIEGSRAKESGWLLINKIFKESEQTLGLAKLKLRYEKPKASYKALNEVVFYPVDHKKRVGYSLFNRKGRVDGSLAVGEVVPTGWMDMNLRLLSYKPHAYQGTFYNQIESPHALSTEAVKVHFIGEDHWLGLDQPLKIFKADRVYVLNYGKKRVDIGFDMKLESFKVGRYQGSRQASSYESVVEVEGQKHLISMNEPFKKNGLTFYQSSFQEDEMGRPTHSVLSVNKDPGRFLKYFGCFLMALGTVLLFYFKRKGHKWRFLK